MFNLIKNKDAKKPKIPPGQIRMQKDIGELEIDPNRVEIDFYNGKKDLLHFRVTIRPDEGLYVGGKFTFNFTVPNMYPHNPPKVLCEQKIYHPNIDKEGNICLNILREDWKPILSISAVIYGLLFLFLEPNPDDPLNKEAAEVYRSNSTTFARNVKTAMRGGRVDGEYFDKVA